jgi:hypothetical protein
MLLFALLTLLLFAQPIAQRASAQYDAAAASACQTEIDQRVRAELRETLTRRISVLVNQRVVNILNVGNSPSERYDTSGYPIVEIGINQASLPIAGAAPGALSGRVTFGVEGTSFTRSVRVLSSGVFLFRFPLDTFPPGLYALTVCGARLFRFEIPEGYDPALPGA